MGIQDESIIDISDHELRYIKRKERLLDLSSDILRITFCGKFKSGKSSLINTLLDVKLLPVRTTTATTVITKVFYSKEKIAYTVKNGKMNNIPFDDIAKHILASEKNLNGVKTSGFSEVCIGIPHDLLNSVMLIDTPGLDDDDVLTEITLNEINNTDLAVIVYDANQLLSSNEKMTVKDINELLGGNVVFAVNRIDQVTDGTIKEVKEVAKCFLNKFGNGYIGKGKIFYTAADGKNKNIALFKEWIIKIINSDAYRSNISRLSRFSLIQKLLKDDLIAINNDKDYLENQISELVHKAEVIVNKKIEGRDKQQKQLINNLLQYKINMLGLLNTDCLKLCEEELTKLKLKTNWRASFILDAKTSIKNYFIKFLSVNREKLINTYNLRFVKVPVLSVSDEFNSIYFPSAEVTSSGWGGAAVGAGIGTFIAPGLGTLVGGGIGKFIDWWKADDKVIDNSVPASMTIVKTEVIPKIRTMIEAFFDVLEQRIIKYNNELVFDSGLEVEMIHFQQLLQRLTEYEVYITEIQTTLLIQIKATKSNCNII